MQVKDVHVELLEHEVAKVPGAFQRLKEVPWVTPLAVGYERLPSLEQLRHLQSLCVPHHTLAFLTCAVPQHRIKLYISTAGFHC